MMCGSGRTNCETQELRETSKAIIIFKHPKRGLSILLGKENNGNYGLFGGGLKKGETSEEALDRELREEMFKGNQREPTKKYNKWREILGYNDQVYFHYKEKLDTFNTDSHKVNPYVVSLGNRYLDLSDEHSGIQAYPLDEKYENERKVIESKMEPNAIIAIREFIKKYPKPADWKKFKSATKAFEDEKLSQNAEKAPKGE